VKLADAAEVSDICSCLARATRMRSSDARSTAGTFPEPGRPRLSCRWFLLPTHSRSAFSSAIVNPQKFARLALGWHARFCAETAVDLETGTLVLHLLAAIGGADPTPAARAGSLVVNRG
jgi:hypothetical protein